MNEELMRLMERYADNVHDWHWNDAPNWDEHDEIDRGLNKFGVFAQIRAGYSKDESAVFYAGRIVWATHGEPFYTIPTANR